MEPVDRVLGAVGGLALAVAAAALGIGALHPGLHPWHLSGLVLGVRHDHWEVAVVAAVFVVVGLRGLAAALGGEGTGTLLVIHEEEGEVRVAPSAVEALCQRVARAQAGVREVRVKVAPTQEGLEVRVRMGVSPDVAVPQLSQDLREAIQDQVRTVVGISVQRVRIQVDAIGVETKGKSLG